MTEDREMKHTKDKKMILEMKINEKGRKMPLYLWINSSRLFYLYQIS
jgi:hypothetical protein